jgi:hypothetical protein
MDVANSFSRRGFLSSLAAFGVAGIPSLRAAALPLKMQPIRGGGVDSVLDITRIDLPVGATRPFGALHLSDTHLNFWDVGDFCGNASKEAHCARRWVRFPQALQSFYASMDYAAERGLLMFHTGDLLDWNTRANRSVLARAVKGVDIHYAIGNHEYHSSESSRMPGMTHPEARKSLERIFGTALTVSSRTVNGVNFVAYDNGETNLREETVAGIKAEFAKGLPVVLMCHIPPVYTKKFLDNSVVSRRNILLGQGEPESKIAALPYPKAVETRYDGRTRAFYDWLRGQRQLKAILCGHTHIQERDRFSDTADMIVAGGNYEGCCCEIRFT